VLEFLAITIRGKNETRDKNRKEWSQIFPVCRWYDAILKSTQERHKKLLNL
jgi:hypothetical protein